LTVFVIVKILVKFGLDSGRGSLKASVSLVPIDSAKKPIASKDAEGFLATGVKRLLLLGVAHSGVEKYDSLMDFVTSLNIQRPLMLIADMKVKLLSLSLMIDSERNTHTHTHKKHTERQRWRKREQEKERVDKAIESESVRKRDRGRERQ